MNRIIFIILLLTGHNAALAQRISIEEYIAQFKETAMQEMQRSGVPASITLAQGILESESGNSELVKKSNNHFGIKCKSTWSGDSVSHDDDATGECFRAYTDAIESYRDHSDFLRGNRRYGFLFSIDPADYQAWAKGLKKAGYATNPRYPELLTRYIEQYNLQQYTLAVLNKLPFSETGSISSTETTMPVLTVEKKPEQEVEKPLQFDNGGVLTSINDVKCVFVGKGTSLLKVANDNKISLSKLLEFNDREDDGLLNKAGYIYLRKKSKTGAASFYIVQPGESLYDVAQATGMQLKYLLEYNNLKPGDSVQSYYRLLLQPGTGKPAETESAKKTIVHQVAPKEGLYAIARTYKVSVQQLREWNNLDSDDLKIGQEIIVSK